MFLFLCDLNLKTFLKWSYVTENRSTCIVCCDELSSCLSHACAAYSDAANKMSCQPTLGK